MVGGLSIPACSTFRQSHVQVATFIHLEQPDALQVLILRVFTRQALICFRLTDPGLFVIFRFAIAGGKARAPRQSSASVRHSVKMENASVAPATDEER